MAPVAWLWKGYALPGMVVPWRSIPWWRFRSADVCSCRFEVGLDPCWGRRNADERDGQERFFLVRNLAASFLTSLT